MFKVPYTSRRPGIDKAGVQFAEDLLRFLAAAGQKVQNIPHFNGQPVNLLALYNSVVSRGGWPKVCQQNGWEEVAQVLGTPKPCANAGHALKSLYYQYLLKYECSQFNRTPIEDYFDDDDAFKRFTFNGPGFTKLPDYLRASIGLSNEFREEDPFEKMRLSLSSGLPNEVDFAINALLVRSADAHHPLVIKPYHGKLLDALAANVGVFANNSGHFVGVYNSCIRETDKDFIRYWKETVDGAQFLELLEVDKSYEQPITSTTESSELFSVLEFLDSNEIRIKQIGTIVQNLSMEDANAVFLATHDLILRFVFLCANSVRSAVFELGLDMLISIAPKVDVRSCESWIQAALLDTVEKCLGSPDRLGVLQGLALLAKIGDAEANQQAVIEDLHESQYLILSHSLCVPDTPIIIFSLEVLYKLSLLGEQQSSLIAQSGSNIEVLVRLVTMTAEITENNWQEVDLEPFGADARNTAKHAPSSQAPAIVPPFGAPAVSAEEAELTANWFKRLYEGDESYAMSMSDVYKDYGLFCQMELKSAPVVTSFIHCFKLAFPHGRTTNFTIAGRPQLCFLGMKRRTTVLNEQTPSGAPAPPCYAFPAAPTLVSSSFIGAQNSVSNSISSAESPSLVCSTTNAMVALAAHHSSRTCVPTPSTSSDPRNAKPPESSLIRTLLATKINRKNSSSPAEGVPELSAASMGQSAFDDWKAYDDNNTMASNRSDGCHFSDGIFSDMESNDSFVAASRVGSHHLTKNLAVSPVIPAVVPKKARKPRKKLKGEVAEVSTNHVIPTNGLLNGNSHLLSDDSLSSCSAPLAVPYVLPEPKKEKKIVKRKSKLNGVIEPPFLGCNPAPPLTNGGIPTPSLESVPILPVKRGKSPKPRRSGRKSKPKNSEDTPMNGHDPPPLDPTQNPTTPAPKIRKPSVKRPRKPKAETSVQAIAAESQQFKHPGNGVLVEPDDAPLQFMCEWEGCNGLFNSAPLVFKHNYYHHVPPATDGFCKWPHCNGIKRQSLSLITHLNETHCSTVELVRQSMRRRDFKRNIISTIPPPAPLPPPVTYSEHAALHSIQARYGSAVLSDFAPEAESSNTKTTRLTAALVLRNIAHYSHVGRIKLRRYEHILTTSAMQLSEASQVIGECLHFLASHKR